MTIGFVNLFAWRPHLEQMVYLARQCKKQGANVCFLACDAALPSCYAREIRGSSKLVGCTLCRLGSVRGYEEESVTPIDRSLSTNLDQAKCDSISYSSAATLTRIEDPADSDMQTFSDLQSRLEQPIETVYSNTLRWIEDYALEGIILFNGRIDVTAAVLAAARDKGVPVICHERAWYGNGLHMVVNDNCLGLKDLHTMVKAYDHKPLNHYQASLAASFAVQRFIGGNTNEWRQYNVNRKPLNWPVEGLNEKVPKILIIPSSANEMLGHPDWITGWRDNREALSVLMNHFGIDTKHYILRAHPNWGEKIGKSDGSKIDSFYQNWCKAQNITYIRPNDTTSTQSLIEQADIIITNGSTAAIEAGFLGKRVINLGASSYSSASFVESILTLDQISNLSLSNDREANEITRQTLRYLYTHMGRYSQFTDGIQMINSADCEFREIPVLNLLRTLFRSGKITPYDEGVSKNLDDENFVLAQINKRHWQEILDQAIIKPGSSLIHIKRRHIFRILSFARKWLKHGDR